MSSAGSKGMFAMILLILLLFFEAALAACRIKTSSVCHGATAVLRAASVLILVALAALSVATWGFRYYAITAVLVVSAVVNAAGSLRKKEAGAKLLPARIIRRAAGMSALIIIALLPAVVFPEYRPLPTTGGHRVETATRHFSDEERTEAYTKQGGARELAVEFWYPENAEGSFPLVIFSHGSFGTRTSNETLFRELASHGYVVCSIDHTYQCLYTTDRSGKVLLINGEFMNDVRRENAREDKSRSLELYKEWMEVRTGDIAFVIETVKADASDVIHRLIDTEKIGVIGHSLGGAAVLGIGRMRSDIGAVVALEAPYLCDILDVQNDAFVLESAAYPVPVLNIYSDSSWPNLGKWPQYAKNVQLLSGSDKDIHNLHISGAGHLSLTDLSLASPILTRVLNGHSSSLNAEDCLRRINEECLAFFDRYLKEAGAFSIK